MAVQILDNCSFDTTKLKTLYIGSRRSDSLPIEYPIQYTTVNGSQDSIIAVSWNTENDYVTIGGQEIMLNKITNLGNNISFSENYVVGSNGKIYQKNIAFIIPNIQIFLINQLKEFTITTAGKFALSPTIAFLIDENDQQLVVGYDKPLYLQNTDFQIGDENQVSLTYLSSSRSRSRAFQII